MKTLHTSELHVNKTEQRKPDLFYSIDDHLVRKVGETSLCASDLPNLRRRASLAGHWKNPEEIAILEFPLCKRKLL